jgi:5'-methylthioadenosine nucleosidase
MIRTGKNRFIVHIFLVAALLSAADAHGSNLALLAGFKSGIVTTGNSLTYTKEDMEVMQEHGVAVKEMEAAAIARLCKDNKVPMFALKAVTDLVDGEHPPQEEFLANLAKSVDALVAAATKILDFVQGKSLSAL